jgi:protein involved in polysaccharide export with SLBB domain
MVGFRVCSALVAAGLAGCAADLGPVVPDGAGPSHPTPRFQVGDKIKVVVYGEDNLGGIFDVDPSGLVSLPLAGTVRAAGRGRAELEREITRKYKSEYLQNPKVTVDFAAFRPFYVLGETEHTGEFPYRAGLTALDAITTAGGMTYRASRSSFLIKHAEESEWRQYPLSNAIYVAVLPGDAIRVPERYF